jgi:uncharacterized phiE125 gp8 family phage protein
MATTNLIDVTFSSIGSEVVDLAYVKLYAAISTSTHDTLLTSLIKAARVEIEKLASIAIVTKTVRAEWDYVNESVVLPYPIINSINSVVSGEDTLVLDADYIVKGSKKKTIYGTFVNGLVVTYTAGYGSSTPEDLKLAIVKHVVDNFVQRYGISLSSSSILPNNWRTIALNYRPTWMMF